jgi:hypothetical protein
LEAVLGFEVADVVAVLAAAPSGGLGCELFSISMNEGAASDVRASPRPEAAAAGAAAFSTVEAADETCIDSDQKDAQSCATVRHPQQQPRQRGKCR